jgi:hypothetical protein
MVRAVGLLLSFMLIIGASIFVGFCIAQVLRK